MQRVNLVPTKCPKFLAACMTCGVKLESGTPGISNVYSKGQKYDPDEPGDIHFYLSDKQGINPLAVAKVWLDPDKDLQEAAGLRQRVLNCNSLDDWHKIANDIDTLILTGAVATMSRFAAGKCSVATLDILDSEEDAAQKLSDIPARMKSTNAHSRRPNAQIAAELSAYWEPAMQAWLKAWIHNYKARRGAWKKARKAIKIEREDSPFPIIIPKGKDFAKLLKRWG